MKFWQKESKEALVVYTFDTVSEVLRFEQVLKKEGVKVTLRPVPRNLSSSCGTCAVIAPEDKERVQAIVTEKNLRYHEVQEVEE